MTSHQNESPSIHEEEEENEIQILRKKLKETQAQIQQLKKAIKSADKKTKKLLELELENLEEIKAKEALQLSILLSASTSAFDTNLTSQQSIHPASDSTSVANKPTASLRTAPKRLNKWQKMELERAQLRETLGELPNEQHLEQVALYSQLEEENLTIVEMPADGHCLFSALSHQLEVILDLHYDYLALRKLVAEYMRTHPNDFLPFLYDENATEQTIDSNAFENYCDEMAHSAVWGGHLEIHATCQLFKIPIRIYQANMKCLIIGDAFCESEKMQKCKSLCLSYHHHALGLGEHYNSVISKSG